MDCVKENMLEKVIDKLLDDLRVVHIVEGLRDLIGTRHVVKEMTCIVSCNRS